MHDGRKFAYGLAVPLLAAFSLWSLAAGAAPLPKNTVRGPVLSRPIFSPPVMVNLRPAKKGITRIKHVVIVMQENRSFDDLWQGYPGANTQSWGYDSNGNMVNLQPVPLEAPYDIDHDITTFTLAWDNGKMDRFNQEGNGCGRNCVDPQYGYVPQSETQPYFNMAGQYALGDNMFTSHIDDSFISHQYIIAAQANGTAYFPSSYWGCDGGSGDTIYTLNQDRSFGNRIQVCWDINTLGDELDAAGKTWRFYTSSINGDGGIWSSYQAIRHIRYGNDWTKDVITPQNKFLTDVPAGTLADVTWIMPTCATSDHSGCGSNQGPSWVTSIVNTIGKSKFWKSTAIFVTWDEWGGWYDHVPPPQLDYDGLGMRVGLLMVSPFAKQNYISHVQYEQGSILRFAEDVFGLGRLAAADARANSPADDAFDFTQKPRKFSPFNAPLTAQYFIHAKTDTRIPDRE